ncbi:MAG: DUF4010 domain-containing protein [Candidatus Binatia bacterium]
MTEDVVGVLGIAAAALGGAAVGVERQWSGHATGPTAHFGGVRTFTLLGGLAGVAGRLWGTGYALLAAALLAGAAALVVAAYVAASRRDIDGTTEVAALVVVGAGTLAGTGQLALASAVIAVTNLVLVEKSRLHAFVRRVDEPELRAAVRFGVMALVILPLLPAGPFGPLGGVRPRALWALVLLFSGLSFTGHVARRAVGVRYGHPIAGLLGGIVSSTAVTLAFARASRTQRAAAAPLAVGVIAASTMVFPRVLLAAGVLDPLLSRTLVPYVLPPLVVGALITAGGMRAARPTHAEAPGPPNPLQFTSAVQMVLLFQAVLFAVHGIRERFGDLGLLVSGGLLGLTDVDALVLSMAASVTAGVPRPVAAQAVALGVLANGALKLALAVAMGIPPFRWRAGLGLAALAATSAACLALLLGR